MEARNQRPLMYVATHGTDDPTLATLPFLVATGAGSGDRLLHSPLGRGGELSKAGDDRRRARRGVPAAQRARAEG